ncbi:MAG: hypothetical protein ACYS1E_18190 [Planctomycetota bacterium]|jgi:hypothetical protein
MKRLVPLWITAVAGFVLIVAYFIPVTQGWGEVTAIWFDILAAIAFVLGGGNLLKVHLKKASDRVKGWGYSVVTVVAFLTMLTIGLGKIGTRPAPKQEFFGETFVALAVESIPEALVFSVPGSIPVRPDGKRVHPSVRRQLFEQDGEIRFRGWMLEDQKDKLLDHREHLAWQCSIERLYDKSQPTGEFARVIDFEDTPLVAYYADHTALSFRGHMTARQRDTLLALAGDENWERAVNELHDRTQVTTTVRVGSLPPLFDADDLPLDVTYDASTRALSVQGPMAADQFKELADLFPSARPRDDTARRASLGAIAALGPVSESQVRAFNKVFDGSWTLAQLRRILDDAGKPEKEDRYACAMLADQEAGVTDIAVTEMVGEDWPLNDAQVTLLGRFAGDETMTVRDLAAALAGAGNFKEAQAEALDDFLATQPTAGARKKNACFAMMRAKDADGKRQTLNAAQRGLLLADFRSEVAWRRTAGRLFMNAHVVKYPWSGAFRGQSTPFWWLYEYVFKPLQATTFAMLAFYVASAAFRAFRAKNIEAILLLGTAFVILLGRTFAGVVLTAWLPDWLSGLKLENLTVYIMQVFNTAGNRAIMIGIALGIASTSLKVLLGVDRSYLGSGEE